MTTVVSVREEHHGGTVVAILDGEVDTANVGEVAVGCAGWSRTSSCGSWSTWPR